MPVLPLFDTPADPDAWHRVIAPGGYERWHFDAEDVSRAVRVIIEFVEGADFDTDYLRRYHRYLRRPTRVQPPQAREYPCVQFSVYENGRILSRGEVHHRSEAFIASDERPDVQVGASGFRRNQDGSLHVKVRQRQCGADLIFHPLVNHPPLQRSLLLPKAAWGGREHHWVVAQPLCRAEGSVRVTGSGGSSREIPFAGLGYHDHRFGIGPLGMSVARRFWGRVLGEDHILAFEITEPIQHVPEEAQVVEGDAERLRSIPVDKWSADWAVRVSRGIVHPLTVILGERLRLTNPRLLDSSHDQLRLEYHAEGDGAKRTAFCEVVYPQGFMVRRRGF
jgi:hypothetical protein